VVAGKMTRPYNSENEYNWTCAYHSVGAVMNSVMLEDTRRIPVNDFG